MTIEEPEEVTIYPANIFVTTKERTAQAIRMIQDDMVQQCEYFSSIGKQHEANRLKKRVEYDMEMIKELGYCPGIENYSRYFDGRSAGQRPFCLIDYFPKDLPQGGSDRIRLPSTRRSRQPASEVRRVREHLRTESVRQRDSGRLRAGEERGTDC